MAWARRCSFLFALGLVLVHAADLAPAGDYEGKPVQEVRFEPPTQPVPRAELQQLLPFHDGTPLNLAQVRAAIKKLYSTGLFSNIEMSTETAGSGLVLVIRTEEQWFVGGVDVYGKVRYPPNEGQLANATQLELGTPFNDDDLDGATKRVEDLLQRNGLYLSKVAPKIDRDPEHQQAMLTLTVDSGKRARFTTPTVMGDTRLAPETLGKAAKFKSLFRWKQATSENTRSGVSKIRRKYEKEERLTANVTLDHRDYLPAENRVRPVIEADGGPKVTIKTDGGKLSKGKLHDYVPVFDEGTVNRDLLVRGVANLRDYFQNRGYFDVEVDFRTSEPSADQEEITYVVSLGERHKVVRIDVAGNAYFKTADIRERMFLQPAGFIQLRQGRYSDGFLKRDTEAITALYQDNGFEDVKVTATPIDDYQGKKGDVAVTVTIEEGVQYRVANLRVDGITRPDRGQVIGRLASLQGQPFSKTNVALDRDYLLNVYQSAGYLNAAFDWRMTPGPGEHQISLIYTINEGQPRFVRDVLLTGLHGTRRRLVDPNVLLKSGDPLSWTQMGEMQRRLYDLGVFDKVDMAVQNPQGDTEKKNVLYHFTEGHRYFAAVGFGAELARIGGGGTDLTGQQGQTGFAPRASFELSRFNMFGLGHSLNFKSRYSTLDRQISLNYLAPRYRNVEGRNISVTALYDNTRDVRTFTARRLEADLQLSQKLSKPTTLLWRYTWRDVRVDQSTLKITPFLIPLLSQPSHIGMISASLIQDRRDDSTDAHRGIYNTADLGLAEHVFGGNKNFVRFLGRSSYYKRIRGNYVLASNTQFGWLHPFSATSGTAASDYIPLPERFFGGGSISHRGFPDNQAGPRDPTTGFPIGGNALLFHSTELRFPFIGSNINGVLFHDIGNIYSDVSSISFRFHQKDLNDFNYAVHAAGFGIRYRTPLGPVRLDLAYSINPPKYFGFQGTYAELLNAGVNPCASAPGVPSKCVQQSVSHFQFFFSIGQAF
jgi:outer membrane protein assembly complex protein YaeT